jgi:acetyltransferase-like isoleucine patch superfamily enzyme
MENYFKYFSSIVYSFIAKQGFKEIGESVIISPYTDLVVGKQYISIGAKTRVGKHIQLTAWDYNNGEQFTPEITIGSNCQIGSYNHITSINRVIIGDGVLTGKFVTITDNSHGNPALDIYSDISPIKRPAYSKGAVVIGNNVWIGDKATILGNVKIGDGCIVGANAVVTKDVPPYSIVGGNPARIIRNIK